MTRDYGISNYKATSEAIPEMTLRAWLVGQVLPVMIDKGTATEDEVARAIEYADEAIKQLAQNGP